jgi:hypothetical protein
MRMTTVRERFLRSQAQFDQVLKLGRRWADPSSPATAPSSPGANSKGTDDCDNRVNAAFIAGYTRSGLLLGTVATGYIVGIGLPSCRGSGAHFG